MLSSEHLKYFNDVYQIKCHCTNPGVLLNKMKINFEKTKIDLNNID